MHGVETVRQLRSFHHFVSDSSSLSVPTSFIEQDPLDTIASRSTGSRSSSIWYIVFTLPRVTERLPGRTRGRAGTSSRALAV